MHFKAKHKNDIHDAKISAMQGKYNMLNQMFLFKSKISLKSWNNLLTADLIGYTRYWVIRLSHHEMQCLGIVFLLLLYDKHHCQALYDPGSDELDGFICDSWILIKNFLGVKYLCWN